MNLRCIMVLLLGAVTGGLALADTPKDTNSPLERFKALLANPPVIEQLVYTTALPNAGRVAVSAATPLTGSTNREYYEVRWQTNAMLHRQLLEPGQAADRVIRGECFSLLGDHFYFLDARTRPSLYVLEKAKAARGLYAGPYHAAHIRITEAALPINLGVNHIYPGMIRWQEDRFALTSMADQKPIRIQGQISAGSNGFPIQLRVRYANDQGAAVYRIQYDYREYRPPWYPSRIAIYLEEPGNERLMTDLTILKVTTAAAPLEMAHFDLRAARDLAQSPLLYLTNDSVFARLPSGRLVETPAGIPSIRLAAKDYRRNQFYYAAAIVWTLFLLVLGTRSYRNQKTE